MRAAFKGFTKAITRWLIEESASSRAPLCDFERIRYELRPCDVLLIEGRSHVGNVIRMITHSPWTHSCLYVGRLHDIDDPQIRAYIEEHYDGDHSDQLLIEGMLGKGTIVTNLKAYKDAHIRICRPAGISRQDAQKVVEYCIGRLGSEYDVRQIFDLARFFFPWAIMPRRWRSSIFSHHPGSYTKTVCSTVIAEAFTSVSFPILPAIKEKAMPKEEVVAEEDALPVELIHRNPRLFTPRDFDYSPYFEIIKYPFIQVVEKGLYRQLPWNKEGLISNDRDFVNPNTLPRQREQLSPVLTPKTAPTPNPPQAPQQPTSHSAPTPLPCPDEPELENPNNNKS